MFFWSDLLLFRRVHPARRISEQLVTRFKSGRCAAVVLEVDIHCYIIIKSIVSMILVYMYSHSQCTGLDHENILLSAQISHQL